MGGQVGQVFCSAGHESDLTLRQMFLGGVERMVVGGGRVDVGGGGEGGCAALLVIGERGVGQGENWRGWAGYEPWRVERGEACMMTGWGSRIRWTGGDSPISSPIRLLVTGTCKRPRATRGRWYANYAGNVDSGDEENERAGEREKRQNGGARQ